MNRYSCNRATWRESGCSVIGAGHHDYRRCRSVRASRAVCIKVSMWVFVCVCVSDTVCVTPFETRAFWGIFRCVKCFLGDWFSAFSLGFELVWRHSTQGICDVQRSLRISDASPRGKTMMPLRSDVCHRRTPGGRMTLLLGGR